MEAFTIALGFAAYRQVVSQLEENPVVVDDRGNQLLALHRALFEAKFVRDPEDRDVAGSRFVAAIANRVVEELAATDPGWVEWRQAEKHPARVDVVKQRIRETDSWQSWAREEREAYVKTAQSDLVASESLMEELLATPVSNREHP